MNKNKSKNDSKSITVNFNRLELKNIIKASQTLYDDGNLLKPTLYGFIKTASLNLADAINSQDTDKEE